MQGVAVVVIECACLDEKLWRNRLEERARLHSGTTARHKPTGWEELQALLRR